MELILKTKADHHKNHLAMWGELVEKMKAFRESGVVPEEFGAFEDLKLCVYKEIFGENHVQNDCFGCAHSGDGGCRNCLFDIRYETIVDEGCLNGLYYNLCGEFSQSMEEDGRPSIYAIELAEAIRDFPVKQ